LSSVAKFLFHFRNNMNSFESYFSEENIIHLLCKERVKEARKRHDRSYVGRLAGSFLRQPRAKPVDNLLPPRARWNQFRPRFRNRSQEPNLGALRSASRVLRQREPNAPWAINLTHFLNEVRERVFSDGTFSFPSPDIQWVLKKKHIYRPLTVFPLMDAIICSLFARYLTDFFDIGFGRDSYAFRSRCGNPMPTRDSAINALYQLRHSNPGQHLHAAECDIQGFFDCVEHRVATEAFAREARNIAADYPDRVLHPRAWRLFQAYLNCYSIPDVVLGDASAALRQKDSLGVFKWPAEALERTWETDPRHLRIGVPQGGAVSGVIANLVLNTADQQVRAVQNEVGGDLHYFRYCDDTIFVARSREHCRRGLEAYLAALDSIKLPYHKPKRTGIYKSSFWEQKSKAPYCWSGRKWFGCVPWVQFIGYQIRYDGLMRVRKDSVVKQKKRIREVIDDAKFGLRNHVGRGGEIRTTKRKALDSVWQRLVSTAVGRVRRGRQGIPLPKCWSFGFTALHGKPIATRSLQLLDCEREHQIRRFYRTGLPYRPDASDHLRPKRKEPTEYEKGYYAQFQNVGGDELVRNPYRPTSNWERYVMEPVFVFSRKALGSLRTFVERVKLFWGGC
jgi:hypothetical protein